MVLSQFNFRNDEVNQNFISSKQAQREEGGKMKKGMEER